MRIISGRYRGKQIRPPKNLPVRPTTDFAKEGLFNVLNNYFDFEGLEVLDLFCGTGNISLEFASREAAQVVSVDENRNCINFVQRTADELEFEQVLTIRSEVMGLLSGHKTAYDVIFADPPYTWDQHERLVKRVFDNNMLSPEGWLIVEHDKFVVLDKLPGFRELRKYGKVNFSIFEANTSE